MTTFTQLAPLILIVLLVGWWVEHVPNTGGDTQGLVQGAVVASGCLEVGDLIGCGTAAAEREGKFPWNKSAVEPFPVLQYAPALLLHRLGVGEQGVFKALSLLSVIAFLLMLYLLVVVPRRLGRPAWAPLLVLLALSGPLLFYANNTFGEMLAAALLVAFVAAVVLRAPLWAVFLVTLVAGLTKETAWPFLILMGALGFEATRRPGERRRPFALALGGGVIGAIAVNAGFNVFRYGTLTNAEYLQPMFQVPSLGRQFEWLVALVVAPNGGILWFWPLAAVVVVLLAVRALRGWRDNGLRALLPGLLVIALLGGVLVGLSRWYSFGWISWGPRLTFMWLPAIALLLVALPARGGEPRLATLLRRPAVVGLAAALITLTALPHIGALHQPAIVGNLFVADEVCPPFITPGTATYYRCTEHRLYDKRPQLLDGLTALKTPHGVLFGVAFLCAAIALLLATRAAAESPLPAAERSASGRVGV